MSSGSPGGPVNTNPTTWAVIITEWALDSYLRLKHAGTFKEYWDEIRPDVERLRGGAPGPDPKFQSSTFWGPVEVAGDGGLPLQ